MGTEDVNLHSREVGTKVVNLQNRAVEMFVMGSAGYYRDPKRAAEMMVRPEDRSISLLQFKINGGGDACHPI